MSLAPPNPPLCDQVVRLRAWRDTDVAGIVEMFQDPDALRWTRAPSPYRERDAIAWLATLPTLLRRGEALPLAVTDAADDRLLASIDLHGARAVRNDDWERGMALAERVAKRLDETGQIRKGVVSSIRRRPLPACRAR